MRKPLGIQKCYGQTDGRTEQPTDRHGKVYSRVAATKKLFFSLVAGTQLIGQSVCWFVYLSIGPSILRISQKVGK